MEEENAHPGHVLPHDEYEIRETNEASQGGADGADGADGEAEEAEGEPEGEAEEAEEAEGESEGEEEEDGEEAEEYFRLWAAHRSPSASHTQESYSMARRDFGF